MEASIRAQYLGFAIPTETARQFQLKVLISFTVISLATASLLVQETAPEILATKKAIKSLKVSARRAGRKIKNLFEI